MKLKISSSVKAKNKHLEFAYNAQEKLRLLHNQEGQKVRDGIITLEDFRRWQEEYFEPRSSAICVVINESRPANFTGEEKQVLLKSNAHSIDLDKDFV